METPPQRAGWSADKDAAPGPPGLVFGVFPGMTGAEASETAAAGATYDPARTGDAPARL